MYNPLLSSSPRFPRPGDSKSSFEDSRAHCDNSLLSLLHISRGQRPAQAGNGRTPRDHVTSSSRSRSRSDGSSSSTAPRKRRRKAFRCILCAFKPIISHLSLRRRALNERTDQRHLRKARTQQASWYVHSRCSRSPLLTFDHPLTVSTVRFENDNLLTGR